MSGPPPPSRVPESVAAANVIAGRVVAAMHRLFGFQYSLNSEPYDYQFTQRTTVAAIAGTPYTQVISITQEADFVCTRMQFGARIGVGEGAGNVIGLSAAAAVAGDLPDAPFTVLITEGSSDRQLSNEPIDPTLAFSTYGGLPGVLARAKLFARNTRITFALVTLKAVPESTQWDLRGLLKGWKIYDARSLDLTSTRL